jgi:hypothetical protein
VISTDGEIAGLYRKMHIPDDPLYFEKFYFTPGDLGFKSIATPFGRLVSWFVGTSGIRKARASRLFRAPTF